MLLASPANGYFSSIIAKRGLKGALHQPISDHPTEVWEMVACRNSPVEIVEEYIPQVRD
tara:strand:+ start:272 stop:448 length:177 start_codon:yes stop_codon:yes gene_type:complete